MLLDRASLAARFAASKEGIRIQIQGIYVDKTCTAATDGHRLVVIAHPKQSASDFPVIEGVSAKTNPDFLPVLIPTTVAETVAKQLQKVPRTHVILKHALLDETAGDHIKIATTDLDTTPITKVKKETHKFPDYEKVIDKRPVLFETSLNPTYIADAAKIAAECSDSGKCSSLIFRFRSIDGQVELACGNAGAERMKYIVMPLRDDYSAANSGKEFPLKVRLGDAFNRAAAAMEEIVKLANKYKPAEGEKAPAVSEFTELASEIRQAAQECGLFEGPKKEVVGDAA